MKIFTCKDRLEDIMTCIYDAWSEALLIGHDQNLYFSKRYLMNIFM